MCNTYFHTYGHYRAAYLGRYPDASEDDIRDDWIKLPSYHKAKPVREYVPPQAGEPQSRWAIRRTKDGAICRWTDGAAEFVNARWGFDRKQDSSINNTRDDTMLSGHSMWQNAWETQRCLIPVSGFYEWRPKTHALNTTGKPEPYAITMPDQDYFWVAGVWEDHPAHGLCYSMVTTEPNATLESIHNRMPVIVAEADADEYLESEDPPAHLLRTWPGELRVMACKSPLTKDWTFGPPQPAEAPTAKPVKPSKRRGKASGPGLF